MSTVVTPNVSVMKYYSQMGTRTKPYYYYRLPENQDLKPVKTVEKLHA